MTNTVLIKRSGVADSVPGAGNLSLGELAINYIDGNLFYKNSSNVVTVIASNKFLSVTGNVTGSQFNGSGAGLTSIPGANVTGTLSIPTTSYAATVSGAAQSNITSVGTLTSLSVTGNINSAGNLLITNNVGVGTTTPASYGKFAVFGTQPVASVGNVSGFFSDGATVSLYVTNQSAVATLRSDGTLAFGSGSSVTERMRITTTGSVGIGTTTPTTTLDVEGGTRTYGIANFDGATFFAQDFKVAGTHKGYLASANAVIIGGSVDDIALDASVGNLILATGDAEKVRITSAGDVGIGTTSPAQVLEVSKSSNGENGVIIRNATSGTTAGALLRFYAGTDTAAIIRFPAGHSAKANELFITNVGNTSPITFATQDTERMRIDSSGNVGIGTASPSLKLQVSATQGTQAITSTTAGQASYLLLQNSADSSNSYVYVPNKQIGIVQADTSANSVVYFSTQNTERMRIDSSGNVGIGTTTPVAKLAVVGGTTNASNLATAYSTAAVNITPKSTSGYSLAFGSGPDDRPYIQMSAAGTAPNDIMIQPYGGYVGIGITVNNVYDAVAAQRPLVVQRSDTSTTLNGSSAAIAIVNGDTTTNNTAQLNFAAITGASTNQYSSAIISAIFGARTNAQYPTGQLVFSTSTSLNTAPSEKMRIDSAGNVGIGTNSNPGTPVAGRLSVLPAANPTTAATSTTLTLGETTNNSAYQLRLAYSYLSSVYTGVIDAVQNNLGAPLTINPTGGNVGINTTTPQFKLDAVQGSGSAAPSVRESIQIYARGYGGSSQQYAGIGFAMSEHTNGYWGSGILARDDTGSYGAALAFYTSTGAASATPIEAMRINSNQTITFTNAFSKVFSITASASASTLVISASPLSLDFRSTTATTGTTTTVTGTPATLTVPANQSFGIATTTVTNRYAVLCFNNAGTLALGLSPLQGGVQLDETNFLSPTSTTTNTITTIYSTITASNLAYRVIGFVDVIYVSGSGYTTAPSLVQGTGGQAMSALSSIGYSQTWVQPTRTNGTTYYNTTGRPITIMYGFSGGSSLHGYVTVNGIQLPTFSPGGTASNMAFVATVVIPPSASYVFSTNGTFDSSWELR